MMDLTWYILGVFTGAVIYWLYRLSIQYTFSWLKWSSLATGAGLLLFSVAWGMGAVLEGVPRAGSMGILFFGLPGLILLTLSLRSILAKKETT